MLKIWAMTLIKWSSGPVLSGDGTYMLWYKVRMMPVKKISVVLRCGTYYNITNLLIDFKCFHAWHCWKDDWYFINDLIFHSKDFHCPLHLDFSLFLYNILSSFFLYSIYAPSIIYLYILMYLPDKLLLHFCESNFFSWKV